MIIDKNTSYIIGLFQTDGNLYKQKNVNKGKANIEISEKDIDILEKMKNIIPYNSNIILRERNVKFDKYEKTYKYKSANFYICNKEFRKFLNDNGVPYGKKSKIIKPPTNIIKEDYIRGLFDGDGSLGFTSKNVPFVSFVSESTEIVEYIIDYISEITNKEKKTYNRNKRDNIYNIVIYKEDAVLFCKNIYYNDCLSLNRKYKISKDIIKWERPENMKNKNY